MPWTNNFAVVMETQRLRGLITDSEYARIRSVMEVGDTRGEHVKGIAASHDTHAEPAVIQTKSKFKFGAASLKELEGVNIDLVRMTHLALQYSTQDFCVYDGLRTMKEQQAHVRNGTSRTMQSEHLKGLAVDLVPWINGKPAWDWGGCYKIACAVDQAATELGIADRITWGGAWDRRLSDFGGDQREYAREVQEYQRRHEGKDFIDGPHYQIRA